MRRVVENDEGDAKEELVRRHQQAVVRLVASVLGPGHRHHVDDAVQDTFLRAFRNLASFRFESKLSTWLHRIAYSVAVDTLRRPALRYEFQSDELPPVESPSPGPLESVLRQETKGKVAEALGHLPPLHRACLLLYYWYEEPVRVISELLDVPENTVKSYLQRGRQRLARRLVRTEARG